ncbi:MAG: methylated-DNA--[protein]-cysteine S-methyltransferase [Bacteroidales bacterium]|nr:methylated-DNA--[protein]-cysteine S-methyltransferase [Bacteroidales bacterium]
MIIEEMTPEDYRKACKGMIIRYSIAETLFGRVIVASSQLGVCFLGFCEKQEPGLNELRARFPQNSFVEGSDEFQLAALSLIQPDKQERSEVRLHLMGTPFQLKVWKALLSVPSGSVTTYSQLAQLIGSPKAVRAVGNAVGKNPVSLLIPCHRVIRSDGLSGGYHWGADRKKCILEWERKHSERECC